MSGSGEPDRAPGAHGPNGPGRLTGDGLAEIAARLLPLPVELWERDPGFEALDAAEQRLVQLADLIDAGETLVAGLALVEERCSGGLGTTLAIGGLGLADLAAIALAAAASQQYIATATSGRGGADAEPGELARAYALFVDAFER